MTENDVQEAIDYLKQENMPQQSKFDGIKMASNIINDFAVDYGLSPDQIFDISNLVASGKLGGNFGYSLIKHLIPENIVSENTFLNILSKVLSNRCANRIKVILIKWIVAVFDLSTSTDQFHCLYNQLFSLIRYEVLCDPICKLIVLLTRKEDVNAFQVNRLLNIQSDIGNQSSLSMLFTVFKKFNPSLVTISGGGKIKVSTPSEIRWREMLLKFNNVSNSAVDIMLKKPIEMVANKEIGVVDNQESLSSFQSLEDVVRHIGQLSYLDTHCASEVYLTKAFLVSLLHISNDVSLQIRLNFWLRSELSINDSNSTKTNCLLKTLVKLTDLTNNFQGITRDYLSQLLPFWNGRSQIGYLSILISQLPLLDYSELHEFVLSVLWKLISMSPSPSFSSMVIDILRKLTCNYINFEIPRYKSLPIDSKYGIDWELTLNKLVIFCGKLISKCLMQHWDNAYILVVSLQYYNSILQTLKSDEFAIAVVPPTVIVFKSMFSCSSSILSEMCFATFQSVNKCKKMAILNKFDERGSTMLNMHILEIFNTLWRHRAFDVNSEVLYKHLNGKSLEKYYDLCVPAATAFSLEHHPAIAIVNAYFAFEKDLTEEELFQGEYVTKAEYLEHLKAHGCSGIAKLITSIRKPQEATN